MTQYEEKVLRALKTIEKGINNMAKELKQATAILADMDLARVVESLPQTDDEEPIDPDDPEVTEDDLPFQ